jgi:hypothetical protein
VELYVVFVIIFGAFFLSKALHNIPLCNEIIKTDKYLWVYHTIRMWQIWMSGSGNDEDQVKAENVSDEYDS